MDKSQAYRETLAMLRKELAELRDREKQVEAAVEVIQQLIPQEELFPSSRRVVDLTKVRAARNGLAGMSMIQAAETVLRDAGSAMHIMEIANEMLARGFPYTKDKNALRASLTGSIERKDDVFRREAPATYGLTIWAKSSSDTAVGTVASGVEKATGAVE